MNKVSLIIGLLCLVVAVMVFVFADGLRRYYSGIFFVIIGAVSLTNAWRWKRKAEK